MLWEHIPFGMSNEAYAIPKVRDTSVSRLSKTCILYPVLASASGFARMIPREYSPGIKNLCIILDYNLPLCQIT